MDPDVDIKQVTGFKTPKQYGCIKLRHGNSYKLSKWFFWWHSLMSMHYPVWQNVDGKAQITLAPSAVQSFPSLYQMNLMIY